MARKRTTRLPAARLHEAALLVCETLVKLDPPRNSPEGKLLRQLAAAVENYEIWLQQQPKRRG